VPDETSDSAWTWDPTLYQGSAKYYARGRAPYPAELIEAIAGSLGLDGTGRLLDCGCGPGSLTLRLAPRVAEAVGIDADPGMIAEARLGAGRAGIANVAWVRMRAEDLPGQLGPFDAVTFAQSVHWMRLDVVAPAVRGMLRAGGAVAHVFATTHEGVPGDDGLPYPRPPRDRIAELIARYLGPVRRAGQSALPKGPNIDNSTAMRAAGFRGPERIELDGGSIQVRTEDDVVASVFSLSNASPHLFGGRLPEFEADLRGLLGPAAADGLFAERMRGAALDVWR
jgi:SAM-dependent methyltransferase